MYIVRNYRRFVFIDIRRTTYRVQGLRTVVVCIKTRVLVIVVDKPHLSVCRTNEHTGKIPFVVILHLWMSVRNPFTFLCYLHNR